MRFPKALRRKEERKSRPAEAAKRVCPHVALVPRWQSVDDIGKQGKVIQYTCESCNAFFSREEGERLKATEGERLRSSDTKPRQRKLKKSA
jgi:hypothetical protein